MQHALSLSAQRQLELLGLLSMTCRELACCLAAVGLLLQPLLGPVLTHAARGLWLVQAEALQAQRRAVRACSVLADPH